MFFPSDTKYKETKLIKQGKSRIDEEFKLLSKWISENYNVTVLNIQEDLNEDNNILKIDIHVETIKEELKLTMSEEYYFNDITTNKQKEIAEKYIQIINSSNSLNISPKINDISIFCFAFEPLAKQEASLLIPEKRIENIYEELELPEIWRISRCFENVTLFVYKDEQKNKIKNSVKFKLIEGKYFDLLKEYDEFNYWKRENVKITIDSKQNFDDNYESSWIQYYD
ncbi:hypothetical protein [Aquimarina latercula]|uniref:hypothetical protein n=1 Tax=Aquimarina latercula TaxID=987 RepID=UPI0004038232|nr:hypothetical protein [Aquimarina latercula]